MASHAVPAPARMALESRSRGQSDPGGWVTRLFPVEPPLLPELLGQGLVLRVVEEELRVRDQGVPRLLLRAGSQQAIRVLGS